MRAHGGDALYQSCDVALLRAARAAVRNPPVRWPDPASPGDSVDWLRQMWSCELLTEAIRVASPGFSGRVDALLGEGAPTAKQIRRATTSVVRYALRGWTRATPFGLFAGVAPISWSSSTRVAWGQAHVVVANADNQWLADVVRRLEAIPELLDRLDVVLNDLARRRGRRFEIPRGSARVSVRYTKAVQAVQIHCASPVQFSDAIDKIASDFPTIQQSTVRGLLVGLVDQGYLITSLRAPNTTADQLAHVLRRLRAVEAGGIPSAAPLMLELERLSADLKRHNSRRASDRESSRLRASMSRRMHALSPAGRTPLAVNLRLDCDLVLPASIASELEAAASVLVRLSRQPAGEPAWREFHTAFWERYGAGTVVPVTDVVDPDAGLGYPAGYPGSVLPSPKAGVSERDERLLALAWRALADDREIDLDDRIVNDVAGLDPVKSFRFPPHVEMAARVYAVSTDSLDRGDYTLVVSPARSAGTLTSRFVPIIGGAGLDEVYRSVPVAVDGALPVQMSFPPAFPHAENIGRVPSYLPHLLPLGEHRDDDAEAVRLDDLAVTATQDALYLVSMSRRQVVEPQVFHALALEKQPPPLARFLAHLSRAFGAVWHEFDWGPAARRLPRLPRVRYRRSVLSPARWHIAADDLRDGEQPGGEEWRRALGRWRDRWGCPDSVELHDADRTLRIALAEPAHAAILHEHLKRHGHAVLTEAADPADLGWIGGHAHDVVVPMITTRTPEPSPLSGSMPRITNADHGMLPASADGWWLFAKLHSHPERLDELIADHVSDLIDAIPGAPRWWFVRYRSAHETDHLRLRIYSTPEVFGRQAGIVSGWAQGLRENGVVGRLSFDTYYPEVGRYGAGPAMRAAEDVFVADSAVVVAQLRNVPGASIDPLALTAVNMVATVAGLLGTTADAMRWLTHRPAPSANPVDRRATEEVVRLVSGPGGATGALARCSPVHASWQARQDALSAYRTRLNTGPSMDVVVEALLHMHHNRALGIDRDQEAACRRLARQAAVSWLARQSGARQ